MFFVGQPWWPTFLKTLSHLQKFPSYAADINLDIFHYEYIVSILNKKLPPLKIERCWAIFFYCNTANPLASRPPRRKVDCKITQTKKTVLFSKVLIPFTIQLRILSFGLQLPVLWFFGYSTEYKIVLSKIQVFL